MIKQKSPLSFLNTRTPAWLCPGSRCALSVLPLRKSRLPDPVPSWLSQALHHAIPMPGLSSPSCQPQAQATGTPKDPLPRHCPASAHSTLQPQQCHPRHSDAPGASEGSAWPHHPALRLRTPAHAPAPGPPCAPSSRAGGGRMLPSPVRGRPCAADRQADRHRRGERFSVTFPPEPRTLNFNPGIQEREEGQPRAASLPGPNRTAVQQQWPCALFLPLLKSAARRALERACFPGRTGQTRQGGV